MRPPRRPRDPDKPAPPRRKATDTPKAKSPSAAAARDARRAAQHAEASGRPSIRAKGTADTIRPARAGKPEAVRADGRDGGRPAAQRPRTGGNAPARPTPVRPDGPPPARSQRAARDTPAREPGDRPQAARRGAARHVPRVPAAPAVAAKPVAPGQGERIAKLLARAGIASRREIERFITEGRVAVGGTVIDTPATILRSLHGVTVDGQPVREATPTQLFRFYKPTGFLTAERDPKGRPTIYDRLPVDLPRVMPVGRLDMNTEGLLLLTTDGGLKRQLELPATGVERVYRARVFGEVSQAALEQLIDGIEIEGVRYGPIDANMERRTGRNGWVEMKLREGKNREVRRVLEYLGLQVSRLIRTSYGPFVLGDLPVGTVDEIRQHDLVAFRKTLK